MAATVARATLIIVDWPAWRASRCLSAITAFALLAPAWGCATGTRTYGDVAVNSGPAVNRARGREALVKQATEGVAIIETDIGRGMGFVIDPGGYVITNRHVVEDSDHVSSVSLPATDPAQSYQSVNIVYIDPERDLALLHVQSKDPLPSVPLATSKTVPVTRYLREKDPVVLLKRLGDEGELISHIGEVTELTVYNPAAGPTPYIGLTSDVEKGQSGGPVFDRFGRVVGVVTWSWKDKIGGYAIPIVEATRMLKERPNLGSKRQQTDRAVSRSKDFLAALGRGDVNNARRMTSPSHARQVRKETLELIFGRATEEGREAIEGFVAAVEFVIEQGGDPGQQFKRLEPIVQRTGSEAFRAALGVDDSIGGIRVLTFFHEFGQAYLAARTIARQTPGDALRFALERLQTVDAARTFALADTLGELAGSEVEIQQVEVVPGAYQPTAVVDLVTTPSRTQKGVKERLTLHLRMEWGDWYVAEVGRTPLGDVADAVTSTASSG